MEYKTNKNGTIHFNDGWVCTDPSCGQFCYKQDDGSFTYMQVVETSRYASEVGHYGKNALSVLQDKLTYNDVVIMTINPDDYTEKEVKEYIAPYGEILEGCDEQSKRQLVAECIFETDMWEYYPGVD